MNHAAASDPVEQTDSAEVLRTAEWQYYFRSRFRLLLIAIAVYWLHYTILVGQPGPIGLLTAAASGHQNSAPAWQFLFLFQTTLITSVHEWLIGLVAWWPLHREWKTRRGRDLVVSRIPPQVLFRVKYLPMVSFFLAVELIPLVPMTALSVWHLFYPDAYTLMYWNVLRFVILQAISIAVLLPLLFWTAMLHLPFRRGLAIPLVMILYALIVGATWTAAPALAEGNGMFLYLAGHLALAAFLARYVSRRFAELLVNE